MGVSSDHEQRTNARGGLPAMRALVCWGCGKRFTQARNGRPRVTCGEPRCVRMRIQHVRIETGRGQFHCACHWCKPPLGVAYGSKTGAIFATR